MSDETIAFLRNKAREWQIEANTAIAHMRPMYTRMAETYIRLAENETVRNAEGPIEQ